MMILNFHGVRGSHPVPDGEMSRYGGCTLCVEIVKTNKEGIKVPVIIDAGTGLIKYGYELVDKVNAGEYSKTFPLFFTHVHPDHLEGFNFFQPIFFECYTLFLLGMEFPQWDVETVLRNRMGSPVFPTEYRNLKSRRVYRTLADGDIVYVSQDGGPCDKANDALFEIRVMQAYVPSHPQQGVLYYRVIDPEDGSSIACIWDIESHPGGDIRVINFSKGADVMIHDTQYTEEEYANDKFPVQGFGHSTYAMAVENAKKAGVKNLIPFHYNPRHSDHFLDKIKRRHTRHPFGFYMSYEGLSLTLDKGVLTKNANLKLGFARN
jgi:phosphoribosyl 1,2-cyclic phosphodiesterase